MKKTLALILAVLFVLSMAACVAPTDTTEPSEPSAPSDSSATPVETAPPEEGAEIADTLYVAYEVEHTTLNPHQSNNGTANMLYYQVYAQLWNTNVEGELYNDLVDTWDVTEDMLTWTITLKSDLKWSDGSALTTQDVYDTLMHAINDETSPAGAELWFISGMEIVDELTMKFYCDEPYAPFRNILGCNVGVIMPSKVVNNYSADEINLNPETFIFNGPYKIVEWKQNDQIVLERNEYYYGDPAVTDKIVMYPITESSGREVALETGEIDIAYQLDAEQVEILKTMPNDFKIHLANGAFSRVFRFGCNDEHMSNQKVRLAIMYAVDAKAICDALFPGLYNECTSATIPGAFGYKNLGVHVQDLDKAKELLAEAGYPDGFKTEIHTTSRYAKGIELAEALAEQLKAVNIEAEVVTWEWAAIQEQWSGQTAETFDQPIFIMGAGCDTLDCDTAFNRLYTTSPDGTNTGTNYGFYSNAEVDALVAEAALSTDLARREECYNRVCEILWLEDPAQIYLYDPVTAYGLANDVEGFWTNPVGNIHLEDAYKVIG